MYVHPACKAHPAMSLAFVAARSFGLVIACEGGRPVVAKVGRLGGEPAAEVDGFALALRDVGRELLRDLDAAVIRLGDGVDEDVVAGEEAVVVLLDVFVGGHGEGSFFVGGWALVRPI